VSETTLQIAASADDWRTKQEGLTGIYPPTNAATYSDTGANMDVTRSFGEVVSTYTVRTCLLRFNGSVIPDGDTITAATLRALRGFHRQRRRS
jgi:hypothetical protein